MEPKDILNLIFLFSIFLGTAILGNRRKKKQAAEVSTRQTDPSETEYKGLSEKEIFDSMEEEFLPSFEATEDDFIPKSEDTVQTPDADSPISSVEIIPEFSFEEEPLEQSRTEEYGENAFAFAPSEKDLTQQTNDIIQEEKQEERLFEMNEQEWKKAILYREILEPKYRD